ncbi:MAG: NAD(P)/FAD-dependent oxidoreductase [Candidatus Omnitrophica bacterium]|nr:NAD(P)/FAD-dependent oxidoreductase [Candidatus Omnitrophota bacterium]
MILGHKYEVVVVGAGPAGLMAARELAKQNIDYLLIDRKKEIGLPLKCAEGVREKEFYEIFGEGQYDFIRNRVHRHEVIYEEVKRVFYADFLQISRPDFEKWLGRGLVIELECVCEDIFVKSDRVEITTSRGKVSAEIVIMCSGCNYELLKNSTLVRKISRTIPAFGGLYKNHGLDPSAFYYYYDKDYLGYFWIFPKNKDVASIGFGGIPAWPWHQANIGAILKKFLAKYGINPELVQNYGGPIPCSGPVKRPYSDRLLLAGDAAGFVVAMSGEGILYALKSGRYAARSAAGALKNKRFDNRSLMIYGKVCDDDFGRRMKNGIISYRLFTLACRSGILKYAIKNVSVKKVKDLIMD